MKRVLLAATLAVSSISTAVFAESGAASGTPFGTGADSIRCIRSISLFVPYAKQGNYADAYEHWSIALKECPGATKNIYIYGVKIMSDLINKESDPAKREALVGQLMDVYDQRVKYFGNDAKYPDSWIIPRKVQDYIAFMGSDADFKYAYDCIKPIVERQKERSSLAAISIYMTASYHNLKADEAHKELYIDDYLLCNDYLEKMVDGAGDNKKFADQVEGIRVTIENDFTMSGAADCDQLQSIYSEQIEEHKTDINWLRRAIVLLRLVKCQDMSVYGLASMYAHEIEATAETARGCAQYAIGKGDFKAAIDYLDQAASMETSSTKKSALYWLAASYANSELKQFSLARKYARLAAENRENWGDPFIMIAQMYAASAKSAGKFAFYAAVDKLEHARAIDANCAKQANSLISAYSKYYFSKEEIFMNPDLAHGKRVSVGGWIGETTTIR